MALWTFKSYLDNNGNAVMDDWYNNEISVKAQARLDKILEHFRDSPRTAWGGNYFKPLTGYDGIFEIRFTVQNIVHRPLGFFGPESGDFTFLMGAFEQGDEFIPRNAPDIAAKQKNIIEKDPKRANECTF